MVLSIGQGHQLVAELGRPPFSRTQRTVLILALVVFGASIHVFLAVAQRRVYRRLFHRQGLATTLKNCVK